MIKRYEKKLDFYIPDAVNYKSIQDLLTVGAFISDEIINTYMEILEEEHRGTFYFFNTF
jgi:Ulp1 family protease